MSMKNKEKPLFARAFATLFSPLTIVVWFFAIVVAVIAGPFGTLEAMGLGTRVVFWIIVLSVSVCLGYLVREFAMATVGPSRPGLTDLAAVGLLTVIFAPFVWGLIRFIGVSGDRAPPTLAEIFFYVFVVAGAVFVVRRLTPGIESQTYRFMPRKLMPQSSARATDTAERAADDQIYSGPSPRLWRRLPPSARSAVLRISARDHHVDVVTKTATTSLRMRLKDAIDEMEPVEGYCTHRSHWVARRAIVRVGREGPQKIYVELTNGDRVPISRTYRPALEEAGILSNLAALGGAISAASARDGAQPPSSRQPPRGA